MPSARPLRRQLKTRHGLKRNKPPVCWMQPIRRPPKSRRLLTNLPVPTSPPPRTTSIANGKVNYPLPKPLWQLLFFQGAMIEVTVQFYYKDHDTLRQFRSLLSAMKAKYGGHNVEQDLRFLYLDFDLNYIDEKRQSINQDEEKHWQKLMWLDAKFAQALASSSAQPLAQWVYENGDMRSASLNRSVSRSIPRSTNTGKGRSTCPFRLSSIQTSCFCWTLSNTAFLRFMIEYHFRGPSVNGTTSLSASSSANSAGLPMIWMAPCLFTHTGGSVTFQRLYLVGLLCGVFLAFPCPPFYRRPPLLFGKSFAWRPQPTAVSAAPKGAFPLLIHY